MTTPLNRNLPNTARPARPTFPMQGGPDSLFLGWGPKV